MFLDSHALVVLCQNNKLSSVFMCDPFLANHVTTLQRRQTYWNKEIYDNKEPVDG